MDTIHPDARNAASSTARLPTPWLPIQDYALALAASAEWRSAGSGVEQRDLHLGSVSDGRMTARVLRALHEPATLDRAQSDQGAHFDLIYVLKGTVQLTAGTSAPILLAAGDCIHQPGLARKHVVRLSEGCELLELAVPLLPTIDGAPFDLETGQRATRPVQNDDRPESYKQGDGPRKYFRYRDLGVAEATGGRMHIHVIKATGPAQAGGTGWHRHTMCQLFYVFTGSAVLEVESHDSLRMHAGDAMCIAAGTKHNVPDFSPDYSLLEVCIPADYDTVDATPPGS